MSFERRWFLTAAGSAFLASVTGALEAKEVRAGEPSVKKTGDVGIDEEAVVQSFLKGYSTTRSKAEDDLCRTTLKESYHNRFVRHHPNMSQDTFTLLVAFAADLGSITRQVLEHEKPGDGCRVMEGNGPSDGSLQKEHIHHAREVLGFALNKIVNPLPNPKGCYQVATGPKSRQINKECPLCTMNPTP